MDEQYRARVWRAVRASRPGFTAIDIAMVTGADEPEVQTYIDWLVQMGFARPHGSGRYRTTRAAARRLAAPSPENLEMIRLDFVMDSEKQEIWLLKESSPGAYRRVAVSMEGKPSWRLKSRRAMRDDLWDSMRELKSFSTKKLAEHSGTTLVSARDYCRALRRSGHLGRIGHGPKAQFFLRNDPGPQRPKTGGH